MSKGKGAMERQPEKQSEEQPFIPLPLAAMASIENVGNVENTMTDNMATELATYMGWKMATQDEEPEETSKQ